MTDLTLVAGQLHICWRRIITACFDTFDVEAYALGLSADTTAAESVAHAHAARLFPALARAAAAAEKGRVSAESESCLQAVAQIRRTRALFANAGAGTGLLQNADTGASAGTGLLQEANVGASASLLQEANTIITEVAELRAQMGTQNSPSQNSPSQNGPSQNAGFDIWRMCVLGDFLAEWLCLLGFEVQREMRDRLRCAAADALAAGPATRFTAGWFRTHVEFVGLAAPRAELAALLAVVPAANGRRAPLVHWLKREPWQHFARATLQTVHETKLRWLTDLDGAFGACALAKKTLMEAPRAAPPLRTHARAAAQRRLADREFAKMTAADAMSIYREQCAHARFLLADVLHETAAHAEWLISPPGFSDPSGRWLMLWTSVCLHSFIEEEFLDEYFCGIVKAGSDEGPPLLLVHSCDAPVRKRLRELQMMWREAGIAE